jgi:hypothetical protein
MMTTFVNCLSIVWESIFDCYWTLYKTQIPNPKHCLDDGPEFRSKLTVLGWILYKIRSLMIRHRHRTRGSPVQYKHRNKCKDIAQVPYDPTHSRLYYSLVANSLRTVLPGYIIHIGNTSSDISVSCYDNTTITTFMSDNNVIHEWFDTDNILYICTRDTCILPTFNNIRFNDKIRKSMQTQNAGGSSEISEAISMLYMQERFHAHNFIPEMEVQYYRESKICDYVMNIEKTRIGVSVTRAMAYPPQKAISSEFAFSLLHKKLIGIIVAKRSVTNKHSFSSSIVHIWCKTSLDADVVMEEYNKIINNDIYNLYAGIYIICSVCASKFIYTNDARDM